MYVECFATHWFGLVSNQTNSAFARKWFYRYGLGGSAKTYILWPTFFLLSRLCVGGTTADPSVVQPEIGALLRVIPLSGSESAL